MLILMPKVEIIHSFEVRRSQDSMNGIQFIPQLISPNFAWAYFLLILSFNLFWLQKRSSCLFPIWCVVYQICAKFIDCRRRENVPNWECEVRKSTMFISKKTAIVTVWSVRFPNYPLEQRLHLYILKSVEAITIRIRIT